MVRVRSLLGTSSGRAAVVCALVGLLAFSALLIFRSQRQETIVLEVQDAPDPNVVRVFVGGAVRQPGLYTLARGSRVADALAAAGGVTEIGDTSSLGLAAVLEDADQIVVADRPTAAPASGSNDRPVQGGSGAPATVNLNTASVAELEQLPGIGPALAARIVEHREAHGPFRAVDELADIRGISERMVDDLRPLVTVGP